MPPPSPPSKSPPPPPPKTHFTPIQECDREEQDDGNCTESTERRVTPNHQPTPSRQKHGRRHATKRSESADSVATEEADDVSVSCNKCRPHAREKFSVVPLDNNGLSRISLSSMASPNGVLKSILSSFTRKSPKTPTDYTTAREEHWKIAVAELSHKLVQATRKRDEAQLEASRLKYSMAELEKKLNKLEIYCHNLKSGLDECSSSNSSPYQLNQLNKTQTSRRWSFGGFNSNDVVEKMIVENFLASVSEARNSIRGLSRSLTMQLRHMGLGKVYEKISSLLQPYDVKLLVSKNPRSLLFYLEALLNRAFFEEFESPGFQKNSSSQILNPIERSEANYTSFNVLKGLTWDEVLIKGTKHFSEEFSGFCDRKMSEIVAMLGWNRAWPEPLLQAFFGASKSVWLVHLLANSVHPSLPIYRVDKAVAFDPVYMEDVGVDKARKLIPSVVRIMVAPGFYVDGNVVKCKVLCRYNSNKGLPFPQSPP